MKWMKTAVMGLALSVIAACAANPGLNNELGADAFNEWDADNDALLSENEFGIGFAGNNALDEWDVNDDMRLDENEWRTEVGDWGMDVGAFDDWDLDNDGFLDEDEFGAGVFNTWDTADDGFLDEGEWGMGMNLW